MAKVVIIGAGLSGLSTAYHLEAQGFFDYKLFEKESKIGGLCRSVQQDGFTFDFTGHLLHSSDPYFKALIETAVGLDHFNTVARNSAIYSHDVYTNYPFQTNLYGLPEKVIVECIEGFVTRDKSRKKSRSYYHWVLKHFGQGFADHFFFPYQTKLFDYDVKQFTHTWTGRFVPKTTLAQIIRGSTTKRDDKAGYNASFLYPKQGGIMFWVEKFAEQLFKPVHTNCTVSSVDLSHKIVYFKNGHTEPFEQLVSTMPLNHLLCDLKEPSDLHIKQVHNKLLCNSVLNFNLGVSKKNLSDKSWIYYPEKQLPFYRIGFPHTFADSMTPKGCSSLYGEVAYLNKPPKTASALLHHAVDEAKKLLGIKYEEIVTQNTLHLPHAYVIYDFWRERHLKEIHARLNEYDLYSIGRYGGWKYSSMQEAVLDGKKTAIQLLTKKPKELVFVPEKKIKKEKTK